MKPENWNKLTHETKQCLAEELLNSIRGKHVMSQALALALLQLRTAPRPERGKIEDMEMLRETLFSLPVFTEGKGVI